MDHRVVRVAQLCRPLRSEESSDCIGVGHSARREPEGVGRDDHEARVDDRESLSSPQIDYRYDTLSGEDIAAASERSPMFDVAAVASVAGLRDSCGNMPLDGSIPTRVQGSLLPSEIGRDARLFMAHVDGGRSLEEIAVRTGLTLPDTIEMFLQLLALGVVETGG